MSYIVQINNYSMNVQIRASVRVQCAYGWLIPCASHNIQGLI